ncbi:MAG: class I SAM-dependent methyltransferase [bacterium]|nr:class I SAM-dependent methyltransferase [bacterium]
MTDAVLPSLYSEEYFQGGEYVDYEREGPALRRNFRRQIAAIKERHPPGAHLWEIGCAYGFFLKEAEGAFRASGNDISEHAVQFARERLHVSAHADDYLNCDVAGTLDVVCLWDTIEHLSQPQQYVEKAWRDLRPEGTIAIETGDIGSLLARIRGAKWRQIHPPTHLHYFTSRSLRTLLERTGFVDVRIRRSLFWRHADTVAFRLLGSPRCGFLGRLYRVVRGAGLLNFAFPSQTFDLITVYARKRA